MSALTFTHLASVLFGAFALYASARAGLDVARADHWAVLSMARVLVGLVAGGAMVASGWFVPAVRRAAERATDGPVRFSLSIVMLVVLFNAAVSRTGGLWTMVPVAAFLAAFILPGTAFRGLVAPEVDEKAITEFEQQAMKDVGERMRKRSPVLRSVFLIVVLGVFLSPLGVFWPIFSPYSVWTTPTWVMIAVCSSLAYGIFVTGYVFGTYIVRVPPPLRAVAMPRYILYAAFSLLGLPFCMLLFLGGTIPDMAARLWGTEVTGTFTVVRSDPKTSSKGCKDRVHVATEDGLESLCNLGRTLGEVPRVGDRLDIRGRSTWFGQTVEQVRLGTRLTDG